MCVCVCVCGVCVCVCVCDVCVCVFLMCVGGVSTMSCFPTVPCVIKKVTL